MNNRNPISVLLVDENVNFLRFARRFLSMHDDIVIVGAVSEEEQALAQVRILKPDVVLIDIAMPNLLGGLQFISRLRDVLPRVGIIALSLIGTYGYRQAVLEAGVDSFVPKAAMGSDLVSSIRQIGQASQTWEEVPSVAV
ncbi:MAG: response regulator transcription factor [Chloroflexi bacterium]|nr:response regulator transcription factor [Chloroflexota bacterium]